MRYANGEFRSQIISGEDPSVNGGSAVQCPSYLGEAEINYMLSQLRQVYGPGFTRDQLCELLTTQLSSGGGFNYNNEPNPDPEAEAARGPIMRDSCSKNYKYIVQFRINASGLGPWEYNGLNAIKATLKLAPSKPISNGVKVGTWRLKVSVGRDAGRYILIVPALGASLDDSVGAPGTDKMAIQTWKNGKIASQKKGQTRMLFGPKLFSINKDPVQSVLNGKKRTYTYTNGERIFSFCAALKREDSCTKSYMDATAFKCKKVYKN